MYAFTCSLLVLVLLVADLQAFSPSVLSKSLQSSRSLTSSKSQLFGVRKRAWTKEELGDDIFDEDGDGSSLKSDKKKLKLEPEIVFFDGPPSISEVVFPAISIFTVIGIIPFVSALSRQFWVRYKFTSRRISIQSGFQGKEQTEIIYPDIDEIRFAYRALGSAGDMVLFLRDGAKVELRHVPKFNEVYDFVLSKVDEECRAKSMKPTIPAAASSQ